MSEPKKILVIDDEEDTVTYLTTLLEDNGYATISAIDGEEGLKKVRTEKPDLVLLDVTMPQKSGMGFYKEIKSDAEISSIPVVFVTGVTGFDGDKEAIKKFIEGRPSLPDPEGFFSKPIDRDKLIKEIGKILS